MAVSWLHVSDFHFKAGVAYDRDVVLRSLVETVGRFREKGKYRPDLIFATGDIAFSGKAGDYAAVTEFFDKLIAAAGVAKQRLFVVPGNHDVDRDKGRRLERTLTSHDDANDYFDPNVEKLHLSRKMRAFADWHNAYFTDIRRFPEDSSCGPVEVRQVNGCTLGILPLNSAIFCQGDDDHEKLWLGRRALEPAIAKLKGFNADLNIALVHHPLDWLNGAEKANIKATLADAVDILLRGHLHENDVESVAGVGGSLLHLSAGAAYQTRTYPNRALYVTVDKGTVTVFPIHYVDSPRETWVHDTGLFAVDDGIGVFPLSRSDGRCAKAQTSGPTSGRREPARSDAVTPPSGERQTPPRSDAPPESSPGPANGAVSAKTYVFLSHATADALLARDVCDRLRTAGLDVFFDEVDIKLGDSIPEKISAALGRTSHFVILLSQAGLASKWVAGELDAALMLEKDGRLSIVVLTDGVDHHTSGFPPLLMSRRRVLISQLEDVITSIAGHKRHPITPPPHPPSAGERDARRRYNDLTNAIARILQTSPPALDALAKALSDHDPAAPLSAGAFADTRKFAVAATGRLMSLKFAEAVDILGSVYDELKNETSQNNAEAVAKVSRHLVPWLYAYDEGINLPVWDSGSFGTVVSIPAGLRTFAEIVMAGIDRRSVAYDSSVSSDGWPSAQNAVSLPPESGMRNNLDRSLREDLFSRSCCPPDFATSTDDDKDRSIAGQLAYLFQKDRCIYLIADDVEKYARTNSDEVLAKIRKRYPALAIIRLNPAMALANQRTFNDIRDLILETTP